MSQKIKKQIKRSMPWLMIISLLFSTASVGLFFNFDFKISRQDQGWNWYFFQPEAQAQNDTAQTFVRVKNAAPEFSVLPVEDPTSTSTSPINVGAAIGFRATANDPENNGFYLIVCSTNSVTAGGGGGAPTCGGDEYCKSGLTTDETEASCVYNNVADPLSETNQWYAFVCDNHATQSECSEYSQGSNPWIADASSPFYVNHAPTITAANTTDDNKDPGGTFTITASAYDDDVMRGAEVLHIYVCDTNSWATSTGCASNQLCTGNSASPDVDCSFATTTPAKDGAWTYYAFVMDDFDMAATGNSQTNLYHVNNVAPTVSSVQINGSTDIQLNLKGAAEVTASTSATISDANGCTDVADATSTIYWDKIFGAQNCTADDNNCYQVANTACAPVAGSCTGSSDADIDYICTNDMAFYALPTDLSSYSATTSWLGSIGGYDEALSGNGISAAGVDVITNTALTVTEAQIAYGELRAGHDTGTSTATTTVINYGNSPLDTEMIGTDMTKAPDYIGAPEQEWGLAYQFEWGVGGTDLSSTTPATIDTDIARPMDDVTNVSDYIYWGIGVPALTPSGDYYGLNTFTAAIDDDGDWELP